MPTPKKPKKVIPLKTVQQLRADLLLREDELELAREDILRMRQENQQIVLRHDQEREGLAKLFLDIRNLASVVDEPGHMPLHVRVKSMIFPAFMLKMAMRKARLTIWTQIVTRLNEFHYRKHEITATTVHVEKANS